MAGRLEGSDITLETEGFGETRPAFHNRDSQNQAIEANQEKNRRVSFSFESVDDAGGPAGVRGQERRFGAGDEMEVPMPAGLGHDIDGD